MREEDENSNREYTSRRNVLKAVGAGGFSLAGVEFTSQSVRANGDTVVIGTLKRGDEVTETKEVSNKWYNQLQRARVATEKLQRQFERTPGVLAVGIARGDSTFNGLRTHAPIVYLSKDGTNAAIPEHIDGVTVKRETTDGVTQTGISGGEKITTGEGHSGSATCRAYKNGKEYMMSCRHIFQADGNNCKGQGEIVGTDWFHAGTLVGDVAYAYQNHDAALCDTSAGTNKTIDDTIVAASGNVVGRATKDGVSYMQSNNTTVQKRGYATGSTSGEITNHETYYQCLNGNYWDNLVRTTATQKQGDSGGPIFVTKNSNEHYLIAIATLQEGSSDDSRGCAAYAMSNENNITFGGNTIDQA